MMMLMLQVSPRGQLDIMLIERPVEKMCVNTGPCHVYTIISLPFLGVFPSTFGNSALDLPGPPPKEFAPTISNLDLHLPE